MMKNLNIKTVMIIICLVGFFVSVSLVIYRNNISHKPSDTGQSPKFQVNKSKDAKYKFLFLATKLEENKTATSASHRYPPPITYTYGKAQIRHLVLSDSFDGRVDKVKTIQEYREAKKAIIEDLTKNEVDVCELKIDWTTPAELPTEKFDSGDFATDGCK